MVIDELLVQTVETSLIADEKVKNKLVAEFYNVIGDLKQGPQLGKKMTNFQNGLRTKKYPLLYLSFDVTANA